MNLLKPLENYAFSQDIGYPEEFKYVYKFQTLSSSRKEDITLLYGLMHFIDDLADDLSYGKRKRNWHVKNFLRDLECIVFTADPHTVHQATHPTSYPQKEFAIQELLLPLRKILNRYDLTLHCFVKLAKIVSVCNQWPDEPHFESYEEMDRYNELLFQSVSDCLSNLLFTNIPTDQRQPYNQGFKTFMKGMQIINLLMDLEEDEIRGHYFLPKQAYNSVGSKITLEAYVILLILGNRFFEQANFLLKDERVEPDVRDLLAGLKEIHDDLRASCFVLRRFEQYLNF